METFDPHKSTTEVRAASGRKGNFRALIIGLVVIIVAFGLIWAYFALMPQGNVIE